MAKVIYVTIVTQTGRPTIYEVNVVRETDKSYFLDESGSLLLFTKKIPKDGEDIFEDLDSAVEHITKKVELEIRKRELQVENLRDGLKHLSVQRVILDKRIPDNIPLKL